MYSKEQVEHQIEHAASDDLYTSRRAHALCALAMMKFNEQYKDE